MKRTQTRHAFNRFVGDTKKFPAPDRAIRAPAAREDIVVELTRRSLLAAVPSVIALPSTTLASPSPIVEEAFVPTAVSNSGSQFAGAFPPTHIVSARRPLRGGIAVSVGVRALGGTLCRRAMDQRGTGRTFGKNGTPPNMTMEQLTQDAIEVAQYVLRPPEGEEADPGRISWGAGSGLNVIHARPELFHALSVQVSPSMAGIFSRNGGRLPSRARGRRRRPGRCAMKQFTVSDFSDMTKFHTFFKWSGTAFPIQVLTGTLSVGFCPARSSGQTQEFAAADSFVPTRA